MNKGLLSLILSIIFIIGVFFSLAFLGSGMTKDQAYEKRISQKVIDAFVEDTIKFKVSKDVQKNTVSIFSIGQGMGFCSGVIIKKTEEYTYVVTCKHCVSPTEETLIENVQADVVFSPMDEDLSLIIIKGDIPGKEAAKLAEYEPFQGEKLVHVGYPALKLFDSIGEVLRQSKDWQWASFKSKAGCSGGGVYNLDRELVGILWGGLFMEPISIYEPLRDIKAFLEKADDYIK